MSDALQSHALQHTRLPCPSPSFAACLNSCLLSPWCHLTISSCFTPFSFCLQSFLASGSSPMSWLFTSGSQIIGILASASDLPMNIQDWFPLGWIGLTSLQSNLAVKTLKSLLQHHSSKALILWCSVFFLVQLSHPHMTTGKNIALTRWTFVNKAISLLFNMLSRFDIAFLPRNKRLLISQLQSPSAAILEPQKCKVSHCFPCFPIYLP